LHADDLAAAEVARDAGDRLHVDQRAAVDLPELLRVELVDQLLDRLADQRFHLRRLHARVLLVADEEQHVVDGDHLDRAADGGLDPLQVLRRAGRVQARRQLVQQLLQRRAPGASLPCARARQPLADALRR
jgi:hypothetical protein